MRRLAILLMLLASTAPTVSLMDDVSDDDYWGYYGDIAYVGYVADSNTARVMDEEGRTLNMRLMAFGAPDRDQKGFC